MTTPLTLLPDATCTFCGCVCDDIELAVRDNRIVRAKNACELGQSWFLDPRPTHLPVARIEGEPASLKSAIERAAKILGRARHPLVYGMTFASCQAQRSAVALAERIGASVDTSASVCHAPSAVAMQEVGQATCSLGEVKNRADLVIYWGANPIKSHPRHGERYAVDPIGLFTPGGRKGRTVIAVDVRRTETAAAADRYYQVKPRSDFEVLWALRAIVKGVPLSGEVERQTGVSRTRLEELATAMKTCRYGVLFFGMGLSMTSGKHRNVQAALELARDLNDFTRFNAKPMRGHGNVTGADQVLSWQTGFPFAVNFSRGYPRYNPGEFTAHDLLVRQDVDAALILAADPTTTFSTSARRHLASIPIVTLDPQDTPTMRAAAVAFTTATFGLETGGTVYRMDDVPIPLRPSLKSKYPAAEEILDAIAAKISLSS